MKRYKITDDSGFLVIVNTDRYKTYVREDWELKELMDHFIAEMNNDSLIIWGTGQENYWTVDVVVTPLKAAFREFTKTIEVTSGRLYFTNYESLTMVASFAEEKLPQKHAAGDYFELPNGLYCVTVRQLCDPDDLDCAAEDDPGFEVIVTPANTRTKAEGIFWSKI